MTQKTKKTPMPTEAPEVRRNTFSEVALGYTEQMAVMEAERCLNCKNTPCVSGCPVNIKIPEFISKIKSVISREHTGLYPSRVFSPLCVAGYVRRRSSARDSVCEALRVSP